MNETRTEQSPSVLEIADDRRGAMRSFGAAGMAFLGALGLHGTSVGKNAANANEVKHQSRARNKRRKSKLGPAGPPGSTGPEGSVGPAGPPGSSPTSKIRYGNSATGSGPLISEAQCGPGEHAVGGSFYVTASFSTVTGHGDYPTPLEDGGVPTGWAAYIGGSGDKSIQAYVICIPN